MVFIVTSAALLDCLSRSINGHNLSIAALIFGNFNEALQSEVILEVTHALLFGKVHIGQWDYQ